jgi:hypothetical protein
MLPAIGVAAECDRPVNAFPVRATRSHHTAIGRQGGSLARLIEVRMAGANKRSWLDDTVNFFVQQAANAKADVRTDG